MPSEDPTPKPKRKSQKPENPELGRFDPFLGRSGFSRGSRFRPPALYTRCPGRRRRTRRPPVKFPGQLPPDAPGSGRRSRRRRQTWVIGFLYFLDISGLPIPPFPPFLDPLNSFPWSLFVDSSPFERYDKNKVGRLLDRVFRQPQQPLDQGEGTDVFLVSWVFH